MEAIATNAEILRRIQTALDHHDALCGAPLHSIALHPDDWFALGWDEFRGIAVVEHPRVAIGEVRISCLTMAVNAGLTEADLTLVVDQLEAWWKMTRTYVAASDDAPEILGRLWAGLGQERFNALLADPSTLRLTDAAWILAARETPPEPSLSRVTGQLVGLQAELIARKVARWFKR